MVAEYAFPPATTVPDAKYRYVIYPETTIQSKLRKVCLIPNLLHLNFSKNSSGVSKDFAPNLITRYLIVEARLIVPVQPINSIKNVFWMLMEIVAYASMRNKEEIMGKSQTICVVESNPERLLFCVLSSSLLREY